MVDGIDANRNKWQDLCLSYQQRRRASLSNQSPESDHSPKSNEYTGTNQHPDSKETLKLVKNTKVRSKSECSQDVRSRVNKGSYDDNQASAGNITAAGMK